MEPKNWNIPVLALRGLTVFPKMNLNFDVELEFRPEALEAIADKAIERNIGARGLRAVMEGLLTQIMYDIPSDPTVEKAVITRECVDGGGEPELTRNPDKVNYTVKLNTGSGKKGKSSHPASAS